MPGVERSAETKGGKSSLGSGSFLFWVLLLVSEDIFRAFLAAAVGFFFSLFTGKTSPLKSCLSGHSLSCLVGSAAQTYRCRLTAARLVVCAAPAAGRGQTAAGSARSCRAVCLTFHLAGGLGVGGIGRLGCARHHSHCQSRTTTPVT